MQRLWQFLLDARTLGVIGLLAAAAFLFISADALKIGAQWAVAALVVLVLIGVAVWVMRRKRTVEEAQKFESAMDAESKRAIRGASNKAMKEELLEIRSRINEAVKTIKSSKLGLTSGSAALYELPWYAVIGSPAAGKSSAILRSGLNFPFADKNSSVLQGIAGTRSCDWFFTTEGILLDTAGRYSVQKEDREEWLGFLSLLKRNRPKAPLNGVIIAANLAELTKLKPDEVNALAKQLRERVQELTERLEIFAPVYVVFTKTDLITGFVEFFEDRDPKERERVWGATLPYDKSSHVDLLAAFDRYFDELYEGLKEASVARMAMHRGEQFPTGVLTFPLEFVGLKKTVRHFIAALFQDNPYQFRPIFRGFYFTSALQDGEAMGQACQRVVERFGLNAPAVSAPTAAVVAQDGFFLRDLFSKVIFADRNLVRQYTSRVKLRWRYAAFFGGAFLFGALLAGWTWSFVGNQQLASNVQADLAKAVKVQVDRIDLQSRLEALEILQDRLEQLQRYRSERPWSLSLGLYQGKTLEAKVRQEYFIGIDEVMLKPAASAIAAYLSEVNANAAQLQPLNRIASASSAAPKPGSSASNVGVYVAASTTDVSEAYNALKTYIMLGDHSRLEAGHLRDQLTRFWRGWLEANRGSMPRERLIQSAERILSFALTQVFARDFPKVATNLALLDTTRETLRQVVKGMPARERIYAEIKARAATRFPPVTVARLVDDADRDIVAGSYAISGAFTREAWMEFIDNAFKEAATKETQADDWVLKSAMHDDLTLEGSPEQIRKALTQLYKAEYVLEWQKFMQGVNVKEFSNFEQAVRGMNRLGDPVASPIGKLIQALYDQTSWDNPSLINEKLKQGQAGLWAWIKQTFSRLSPASVDVNVNLSGPQAAIPMGPIGKEFSGLMRLMVARDNGPNLLRSYLDALSKVRTRFNQIQNQGDTGPASRQLMMQTLEGTSELSEALKLVDEQLLTNQSEAAKNTLRPILVRPLMQSFATVVAPTEKEINRVWSAQVYEPFLRNLSGKYPFDSHSQVEATSGEISKVFGPDGSISKFSEQSLGSLVVRRGDTLAAKTWADMGLRLRPELTSGFSVWVSSLATGGAAGGGGTSSASSAGSTSSGGESQTNFQVLPIPATDMAEFTLEIDGQKMRYRNAIATWNNFVWPGSGTPGVRISGLTIDGRAVEFLNVPGKFGLEKMFTGAKQRKLGNGWFELTWPAGAHAVSVQLRLISSPTTASPATAGGAAQTPSASGGLRGISLPSVVVGVEAPAASAEASETDAWSPS